MKGHEIINYITSEKMPDIEQVRENCLNQSLDSVAKRKTFRLKPTIITAIIFIAAIALIGAAGQAIFHKYIDADGNIGYRDGPLYRMFNWSDDEKGIFEREFNNDFNDENLLAFTIGPDYISQMNPRRKIKDFEELQKYINGEIFALPQYIPDGYVFDSAEVLFFIDESFDLANAEPVVREEKFGNIYAKYYIPENLNNIEYIWVLYKNDEYEDGENTIGYSIHLRPSRDINMDIRGWDNTEFEILDLPQFSRSVLQSTHFGHFDRPLTEYIFNGFNSIAVKHGSIILIEEQTGTTEFGAAHYNITMDSYDDTSNNSNLHGEIIKMAESIK